jgi:hypothetical protein
VFVDICLLTTHTVAGFVAIFHRSLLLWSTVLNIDELIATKELVAVNYISTNLPSISLFLSYAVPSFRPYSPRYRVAPSYPTPSALFSAFDQLSELPTYSKELPLTVSPYLLSTKQEKHR